MYVWGVISCMLGGSHIMYVRGVISFMLGGSRIMYVRVSYHVCFFLGGGGS